MARLIASSRLGFRWELRAAVCGFALLQPLLLRGQTPQVRSIAQGVYTAGQAARGQQLYKAQCAACHGNALEGTVGAPLEGDSFLSNWSARSLANLVDKIQKTMPFEQPGTLTRPQAIDLTAYILATGKFPAGTGELSEAALAQTVFPTVRSSAASAGASRSGTSLPPPEGNLAELMRAIAFPNSNILFNVQIKDPGAQAKKQTVAPQFDYAEWGSGVYSGWLAVDQAAVAITETAPLLLTPGRRCQNGKPVPVDAADWKQYVAALSDVGKLAYQASKARNFEAFTDITEKLNDACANCHKVYRDKGGTEGSGGTRCQPSPQSEAK
jgi:mono/diheme cytochrome c family protein